MEYNTQIKEKCPVQKRSLLPKVEKVWQTRKFPTINRLTNRVLAKFPTLPTEWNRENATLEVAEASEGSFEGRRF